MMSRNSFLAVFYVKIALFIFLTGKVLRFVFFTLFIFFLVKGSQGLAGYTLHQSIFFFLTFNLVDITSQFLFREVYRFRPQLISGDFDLALVKPFSPLFMSLMGGADIIDLITIPPLIFTIFYIGSQLTPSILHIAFYVLLIVNGLLIATAFHIFVLGFGIITLEVDHLVFIYRDIINLGKLPVDIYREPIRSIITYLIPVGVMITLPAKALMGLVSPIGIIATLGIGAVALVASYRFWNFALTRYTSASS